MGGFTPAVALQVATGVAGMAAQNQQAKAAANARSEQQDLQYRMLWQQQQVQAKQQRDLLKRQLASTRAALAGGGIGFNGGSGQALMQGLTRRAEEGVADGYAATSLQHQARFGTGGHGRPAAQGLLQGLETAQKGFQILRPLFD